MEQGLNLQDNENQLITIALARTNGNRVKAAELLGIHVRSLYHKMKTRGAKPDIPEPKIPIIHKLATRSGPSPNPGSWLGYTSCGLLNLGSNTLTTLIDKVTCKNCLKAQPQQEAKP